VSRRLLPAPGRRPGQVLAALMLAAGCRKSPPPPSDVIAEARSGNVRLEEVERALTLAPSPAPSPRPKQDEVAEEVERYRKAAEALVVEKALLGDLKDPDSAIRGLGKEHTRIRREVVVDVFERESQAAQPYRVTEADIKEYFQAHPEEFHRPAQRFVWHLFRRHEDPARPEATIAFLKGLKQRVKQGEPFGLLAKQYSHSETRLLEGRIGVIGRGRLPKPLDDVVFSLPEGAVSEPVPVKGGALLFEVTEVFEEKRFPLEDVRTLIAQKLRERKTRERIAEALGDRKPSEGSVVLDAETLARQLEGADEAEVILKLGATEWTVKDFREAMAKLPPDRLQSLPGPSRLERQKELYERLTQQALLFDKLEAEGFAAAPQRQRLIAERIRALGRAVLVRQRIEERIWKEVDADPAALRRFHEENRFLYQSPLRLKIKTLSVPLGPDSPGKMAEMEAVRESLAKGRTDLDSAAKRLGGHVRDGGWLDPAALAALEPKVRLYLLDMNGTGYTVPFQLNRQLSLVFVEKRDEPRFLPFEEAKERVRQDYRDRKQQELYQAVVQDLLRAEGFRFHEEAVRRALGASPARS